MEKPLDRRVRRTRKLIQEALFSLMKEMPYRRIHIGQITERADISRSTFYLHYETKDDLLLSVADEIIDNYFRAIYHSQPDTEHSPAYELFAKWKQNIGKMRLLLGAGLEFRIYERFRALNLQHKPPAAAPNPILNDYISTMVDGAHFALLLRWTRDNAKVSVDQMDQLFSGLHIQEIFDRLEKQLPTFGQP